MDQIAENYQLKWHSFSNYLHSCIATSLQSENFADVALMTIDGRQILAHRFVLSACSQYLHQVLKLQPKAATALPLVIILPPEISYRTMKTLIQYMYSGEATVSKDILEPVLRGGDILKVKGLWRPKEAAEDAAHQDNNRLVKVVNNKENRAKVQNNNKASVETAGADSPTRENNKKRPASSSPQGEVEVMPRRPKIGASSVIKSTEDEKNLQDTTNFKTEEAMMGSDQSSEEFLVIKEEPLEWSEVQDSEMEMELVDEKMVFNNEMDIKPEVLMDENGEQPLYSPLTCELCTETFTLPADWVRHVQTHTDMLPAKRQRRGKNSPEDESDAPFPQLHCDLCQKYFPTPAEWVHHIQNTHTEFELHLSNKTSPGNKIIKSPKAVSPAQNTCSICSKKFPSHASLLIHKRTHTGEKPYMCELCFKGFNVKSNLLRHLRTVHDKIINPADVEDSGKEDSAGD